MVFLVRRNLPGASKEDVEAGLFRTYTCVAYFPGVKWISSFWDQEHGQALCVYEAESAQQLRDHSERARVPCDEVVPVDMFGPAMFAASEDIAIEV